MNYPLDLSFKILSIGSRIQVIDASGEMVAYVRQQAFRLRERVNIYRDEDEEEHLYYIEANQISDFNASYSITDAQGSQVGSVGRRGMRSIWRAHFDLFDPNEHTIGTIEEEDPKVKALDGLIGAIPILGMASNYLFHPAYLVNLNGTNQLRLVKQPAFFESRFRLDQVGAVPEQYDDVVLPSIMMMLLLERARG